MATTTTEHIIQTLQSMPFATSIALGSLSVIFFLFFIRRFISRQRMETVNLPTVPEVPGRLPLIGHLLQLKEKKPYMTFTRWAEQHGPVYSIQTGASTVIVLNSTDVAKEAMVTRYPSISTRKLPNALKILTADKCMVAMSDYNEFHKTAKQCIMTNLLGPAAQKRHRGHRDTMMENLSSRFHAHIKDNPLQLMNFRKIFESELFALSMKQAVGKVVESLYVKEFGTTLSKDEILRILVLDLMEGAIEVDWRDFFPYLRWVPNNTVEKRIQRIASRRQAVMNALLNEANKRIALGQELDCYVDHLISEAKSLTEQQLSMLLWETIIESSDTTLVSSEWAMYELAKNQKQQDRLFREIQAVCGSNKFKEENIARTPYLTAVFHETVRRHGPVPIIPLRFAHEDTEIGGYKIPAGSEIAINIYGCNMDKNHWESPEEWKPERFLDEKYNPSDLYKTMAFGAGKRVCAGTLQAYLIACTAIGRMVQEFQWSLREGDEESVDTVGLTTHKKDPLQVTIRPRN